MVRLLVAALGATIWLAGPANAQTIKIVVPFAAGGPVDQMARLLASELPSRLGVDVIVENRGGAGGALANDTVVRAPPDGRTLLLGSLGSHVISASLRPPQGYDPLTAFAPIALIGQAPSLLVVSADYPVATLADLIAKAKQGNISYGSAGAGTTMNIAGEQFNQAAGVKTSHVPYRGAAPAITDLLGGHIQFLNADLPVLLPQVTSGKLRALALYGGVRSKLLPNLPTATELGYPGMIMENWYGLFAPAGLPAEMQAKLEKAVLEVVAQPAIADRLAAGGLYGTTGTKGFAERLAKEFATWGPTIKTLGIKGE